MPYMWNTALVLSSCTDGELVKRVFFCTLVFDAGALSYFPTVLVAGLFTFYPANLGPARLALYNRGFLTSAGEIAYS